MCVLVTAKIAAFEIALTVSQTQLPLFYSYTFYFTYLYCLCSSSQVQSLQIEPEAMEISGQQDLERKMAGFRNDVQVQIVLTSYAHAFAVCVGLSYIFPSLVHGTCNHLPGGAAR